MSECPRSAARSCPEGMSHSFTSPSSLAVARVLPSAVKAIARIVPLCPLELGDRGDRVLRSQSLTNTIRPAGGHQVAPLRPGANATARTEAEWPASVAVSRPVETSQTRTILS